MSAPVDDRAAGWATPHRRTSLRRIDELLRNPRDTLTEIATGQELAQLARAMILTIAVGGALFGAAMGAFRGGMQIVYAAVKLPLCMLLTVSVCAPALSSLNAALGRSADVRRDLALVLSALARASLVLGALAPVVLLAVRGAAGYHVITLLSVGCCALAGAVGLVQFWRGLSAIAVVQGSAAAEPRRWLVGMALLVVFSSVGTQMAWTLRPFLLRPRTPDIPLVRGVEDSFLEAVVTASQSARGIYHRDAAPLPERATATESAP